MPDCIEVRTADGQVVHRHVVCTHDDAVPVDSIVTGETVAWYCLPCDLQLPADWRTE